MQNRDSKLLKGSKSLTHGLASFCRKNALSRLPQLRLQRYGMRHLAQVSELGLGWDL